MEKRRRSLFVCQQCGRESPKWLGRCPDCEGWNTFVETVVSPVRGTRSTSRAPSTPLQELSAVSGEEAPRLTLSLTECNRVLGGGIVPGSLVLVAGDPGIGKSTLLLQISALVASARRRSSM